MADRIRVQKGVHIYRRPDSPTWWADVCAAGRRARRSTGTENEEEASRIARSLVAGTGKQVPAGFTLDDAYLQWLAERERSDTDRSALRVLREKYANRAARLVDNGSVSIALADMKPGAYNRVVNVLRAALNLAKERGQIDTVPKLPRKEEAPPRVRFLSQSEWARLKSKLPAHLLPAVEFTIATGLRRSNVLGMQWTQVDMDRKLLHLAASVMKARKAHTIPLGAEAMRILAAQKGRHEVFVFPYRGKRILDPKTGFNAAVAAAKIEDFHWHDLRHTWASWMAMAGAPLHAIKQAGAWASMDMVDRYSHLTPNALAAYQDAAVKAISVTPKLARKAGKPRQA